MSIAQDFLGYPHSVYRSVEALITIELDIFWPLRGEGFRVSQIVDPFVS